MFSSVLRIVKKKYSETELLFFKKLQKTSLFRDLSQEELSLLTPLMLLREYKKDEVVFFRDDPSMALYLVQDGTVEASLDLRYKKEVLFSLSQGDSFGHTAFLSQAHRLYNAIITSDTAQLHVIPHASIEDLMGNHKALCIKILQRLALHYHAYMNMVLKLYQKDMGFFELEQVGVKF